MAYVRIDPTHITNEVADLILQKYKKPKLRWPSEEFEYSLKEEFQNDAGMRTFKNRVQKLRDLRNQWKPYARLIEEWRVELNNKIELLKTESNDLPKTISELESKLQEECSHPIQFQVYSDSSTDDEFGSHWYTDYWTTCTICGKSSSRYIRYRGGRLERRDT